MGQKLEDVIFPPMYPISQLPAPFWCWNSRQGLSLHHGKAQKKPPIFCCRRKRCTGENAARREVFFGGKCNASWGRERTIVKPSKSHGIRNSWAAAMCPENQGPGNSLIFLFVEFFWVLSTWIPGEKWSPFCHARAQGGTETALGLGT